MLGRLSGLRYSGEMGHPFHVLDDETVILSLDHPFVPEGRFASLLVQDRELAASLTQGFETLWQRRCRTCARSGSCRGRRVVRRPDLSVRSEEWYRACELVANPVPSPGSRLEVWPRCWPLCSRRSS